MVFPHLLKSAVQGGESVRPHPPVPALPHPGEQAVGQLSPGFRPRPPPRRGRDPRCRAWKKALSIDSSAGAAMARSCSSLAEGTWALDRMTLSIIWRKSRSSGRRSATSRSRTGSSAVSSGQQKRRHLLETEQQGQRPLTIDWAAGDALSRSCSIWA